MANDSDLDLLLDDEFDQPSSKREHDEDGLDVDLESEESREGRHRANDETFIELEEEEEDDEVSPSLRRLKGNEASHEDEGEEDDEDEVVKPAISPILLGAVALTVIGVGGAGAYVLLNKNSESSETPMVSTSMPAPSIEDLGKDISIPSTNLVDENPNATIGENGLADGSSLSSSSLNSESVVPEKEISAIASVGDPVVLGSDENKDVVADKVPAVFGNSLEITSSSESSDNQAVEKEVSSGLITGVEISKDVLNEDLQKLVTQAVQDAVSNQQTEDLRKEVETLRAQLNDEKSKENSAEDFEAYKKRVIGEIKENKIKAEAAKKVEIEKVISKAVDGKNRLPGFQVVNATADATISIIKSPSGRTFALFKGEKFRASNGSILEVKEIVADGKLVVAGDGWYIDETLEKPVSVNKPTIKKSSSNVSKSSVTVKKQSRSLSGWSFHASFEGGGYLVKSPSGEYKTVKKGVSEDGLGVIFGVDDSGNLKTEKGIISGNM